jgi:hypothetical protein
MIMRWEEAKKIFTNHLALTARQYSKITKQHYNNARRALRNWVLKGHLAVIEVEERFPFAKNPSRVIYYCLPKNIKKVEKCLSQYSNISVKRKFLLRESL